MKRRMDLEIGTGSRRIGVGARRCAGVAALALAVAMAVPVVAAPPVVGTTFQSVTVDGDRLGDEFTPPPDFISDFPTVFFDPATQVFHLWVHDDADLELSSFRHATSTDGVAFTSTGNLFYSGGAPMFSDFGATEEPIFQFIRAARFGTDLKLLMWTPLTSVLGEYDYNVTVFNLGADPNTLAAIHQGPVQEVPPAPGGTSGLTNGPWGLIGSNLFAEYDAAPVDQGIAHWDYTDASPPSAGTPEDGTNLIAGTGFGPGTAYPSNAGRTLDQGDGTLGTFYALRNKPAGSRANKQIYYVESANGGTTWTAPVGLFADGNAVTVDGLPNTFEFSHPEVALVNGARVLYFSTAINEAQNLVFVTNVSVVPTSTPTATGTLTATATPTVTSTPSVTSTASVTPTRTNTPLLGGPGVAPAIPTVSGVGAAVLALLLLAVASLFLVRRGR